MHFFGVFGMFLFLAGFIILIYLSILHFLGETIGNRPLLVFGVLFVVSGFQVLFTGFLADLILHFSKQDSSAINKDEVLLKYQSEKDS